MYSNSLMKWESKSKLSVYSFKIDVDKLVEPVYNLILDVVKGQYGNEPFHIWANNVFDIKVITGCDRLDKEITVEIFGAVIARRLKQILYENMDKLQGSCVEIMYATKGLMVASANQKMTSVLVRWIKKAEMMKKFLDMVLHSSIDDSKETLVQLLNDQYFGPAVQIQELTLLKATPIPLCAVNDANVLPVDSSSIWFSQKYCELLNVAPGVQYGEVVFSDIDDKSICVGEWLIPLTEIDHHVKEQYRQSYYWEMLNNVYTFRKPDVCAYRNKCEDFKAAMKNRKFALLMSKLQYNLYIKKNEQEIPEEYRTFFEEVYNIEEFLDNNKQILFTGMHTEEQLENKQTMLGIYQTEKTGKGYNLHAWINADSVEMQTKTTSGCTKSLFIKTVYALKPHYSYYFSSKYFEDLFQELLKELNIETLHDVELYQSEKPDKSYLEVDNFVRKADGTIVLIETKTTLNKYNIEEMLGKVVKYHKMIVSNYSSVRMEYLIVAPYQNATVEETYSFFTNSEDSTNPNVSSLVDFYLPVAQFKGVRLRCVTIPDYVSLKNKMEQLLK